MHYTRSFYTEISILFEPETYKMIWISTYENKHQLVI